MEKVRAGIIGIGNMGSNHARQIYGGDVPKMELTALCDISPERKAYCQKLYPDVAFFESSEELIRSGLVDVVIIAVPHYDHPPMAIDAFRNGLNVIVEKPAGVYTKQVLEMNEEAKKSGKLFCIMYNQRTDPLYQKVKKLVESGELGAIKRVQWTITSWYRPQAYHDSCTWRSTWKTEGGGLLINQCPHNLDILQWIFGVPDEISAHCEFGKYYDIEVEDEISVHMHYKSGLNCVFIASTGEAPGTNRLEIAGSRGQLVLENNEMIFKRTRVDEREFNKINKVSQPKLESWECKIPMTDTPKIHQKITQNFVNAIEFGQPLIAPGESGINEMNISNAVHMSAWTKQTVSLPVDPDAFYEMLQEKIKNSKR